MSIGVTTSKLARAVAGISIAVVTAHVTAQSPPETAPPSPSTQTTERNVRISFLPPPIEGTISLGIYDGSGKLVRVLHRESDVEEFEAASDALVTHWDGKDDGDKPLAPGKYHARGYAVGELSVEGIGFYFNDWVSDERPERVAKICAIASEADTVVASAQLQPHGAETLICSGNGDIVATREETAPVNCNDETSPTDGPIATASGKDHTQWVIERSSADPKITEVKQYSATKELLRRMTIKPEDPQPRRIAASLDSDRIYLLEQNETMQRLRGLTLVSTTAGGEQSNSDWKVDFEKTIVAHQNFALSDGRPVATGGEQPPDKVAIRLTSNPLHKNEKGNIELAVGHDDEGSFLQTADGLPLQTISDTPHLTRTVIAPHDAKSVDVFQDDGAVVEQFRVANADQMMAFDCGEIELK